MMIRVVAQHAPTLYAILGLFSEADCKLALTLDDEIYDLVARHRTWVLYRRRGLCQQSRVDAI